MMTRVKIMLLAVTIMLVVLLPLSVLGAPSVFDADDTVEENTGIEAVLFEDGNVVIDIGERASQSNVRYAEINGVQTLIVENNNKYSVPLGTENMLVEITEKQSADSQSVVKTQYFFVDAAAATVRKLDMDTFVQTYEEKSVRTVGNMGVRFKAHMLTSAKHETKDYSVEEYGYIVALESALKGQELTLSSSNYISRHRRKGWL